MPIPNSGRKKPWSTIYKGRKGKTGGKGKEEYGQMDDEMRDGVGK